MNKIYKSTLIALTFPIIMLSGQVFADSVSGLSIVCGPGLGSDADNCHVESSEFPGVQNKNAPLFEPLVYPHFDLKPGDTFERVIHVDNNRDEECFFELTGGEIKTDTEVLTDQFFSQELKVKISDGTNTIGPVSFYDLFNTLSLPLYLTTLSPDGNAGDMKQLYWEVSFDKYAGNEYQNAELIFDFDWNFQCGQEPPRTVLFIDKTNDKLGIIQSPGDDVKYTITVTTHENPVFNVIVLDLPPGGFTYRGGSWTAQSTRGGGIDLKASLITTEPTYSSPGKWILGDMEPNETVTLTYVADIATNQQPGEYPDIAWTEGTIADDPSSGRVMGTGGSAGFFVGTSASVDLANDPKAKVETSTKKTIIEEGEVLGTSTLPATGADNIWAYIVVSVLALGVIMIFLGVYLKRKSNKTVLSALAFIILFSLLGSPAFAQNVLIRLQQPTSPNRIKDLKINFVVMDVEGRSVLVKCYKNGPGDGAVFTQFGSDINTIPGGDDDYCYADSGVMSDDGTYQFYATALAGADPVSVSPTISLYHDSEKPGKPKSLKVDEKDTCEYKISFKTAADGGDTTRVEVYRSDDKDFTANASTKIKDITVGSDEEVSFTTGKPNCGKTYYFAVIAFDDADNRSDVLSQTIKKTETITITSTTTEEETVSPFGKVLEAIPTAGGNIVAPEDEDTGQVEGDESETPEVMGAKDYETPEETSLASRIPRQAWLYIMIFILVAGSIWYVRRKRSN